MRRVDVAQVLRAGVALFLLAYLPGRVWTAVLLPELRGRLERAVVSVVLSVCMLLLALYIGNATAGVPIDARAAIGWSVVLSILGAGILMGPWAHRRLVVVR